MTTLGDQTAQWIASGDGLLPVVSAYFFVLVVTLGVIASALAIWRGIRA